MKKNIEGNLSLIKSFLLKPKLKSINFKFIDMKTYTVVLLLLVASFLGNSQNTVSFIIPDSQWSVAKTYPNGNPQFPGFIETRTEIFGFIGDTIINQTLWHKYYSTYDIDFQSEFTLEAYLSEENGFVFAMHPDLEIDTLYNFNIQPGDSICYDFGFGLIYLKIVNMDSLLIGEVYHKRFHFEEPYFPPNELKEIWIEGIGSIHGSLFPINPKLFSTEIPDSIKLTCYSVDGTILWQNPDYENCYITNVLSIDELGTFDLKVYPNPAKTQIYFELPANRSDINLQIKDIFGKSIAELYFKKDQTHVYWNCSAVKTGIYFYQTEITGVVYRGKIVVN
jgi:hypothetical protein